MSVTPKHDSPGVLVDNPDDVADVFLKRAQDFVGSKAIPMLGAQQTFWQLATQKAPVDQLRVALGEYRARRKVYLDALEACDWLCPFKLPTPHTIVYQDHSHEFNTIVILRTIEEFDAKDPTGKRRLGATVAALRKSMPAKDFNDPDSVLGMRLAPFGYSALPELYHRAKTIYATLAGSDSLKHALSILALLKNPRRRKVQGFYGFCFSAKVRPLSGCGEGKITVDAEEAALVLLFVCGRLLPPGSA